MEDPLEEEMATHSSGSAVEESPVMRETLVPSLGWEDPWRRERQPTLVFWAGEFHGLHSPCKESAMTERVSLHQYSYLKNPMDTRAWLTTVHGVTQNQT